MNWISVADFEFQDILYHHGEGIAKLTINRPEVRNAFRPETVEELMLALTHAHSSTEIGTIILTGAGEKAFCSGGDQRVRAGSRDRDLPADPFALAHGR